MVPSQEEKQAFLALLRTGTDPSQAARMISPDYTASLFKRLTNEGNRHYDHEFAADYLRARSEGAQLRRPENGDSAKPRTTTLAGHVKAAYLTPEMLDGFLDEVANGVPLTQAAAKVEPKTSLSQLNRRARRDQEFADRFASAKERGYPVFVQNLKDEAIRQAYAGDYRALRDQLLIHDKEFRKVLLAQKHEISGADGEAIKLLAQQALPDLPPEMLEALIETLERKQIEA